MKRAILVTCMILALAGCDRKPDPTGPVGDDDGVEVYTDELSGGMFSDGWWEIEFYGIDDDDFMVTVHLRRDDRYSWFEPEWEFSDMDIFIHDPHQEYLYYEYRVAFSY